MFLFPYQVTKLMHFNFQKTHFLKLQINENKFAIKIKKVHQATLFQTLNHTLSLMNRKNFINTINTKRTFLWKLEVIPLGGKRRVTGQPHFIPEQPHWRAFSNMCYILKESCGFTLREIIFHPADTVNNSLYAHRLLSREQKTNCWICKLNNIME